MSESAIHFHQVEKSFKQHQVLEQVSFTVEPGEFFALLGINGAGKTTLIKCLLDFSTSDGGSIRLFGVDNTLPVARERMVFLPERFSPPYYLTGWDFLDFVCRMHDQPVDRSLAATVCEGLDLRLDALDNSVRSFSKGMAQKLGLASCLLTDKELLLLDEPMSGLDPKARTLVKRRLLELRSAGKTLFFSTHLLADVEELCDRMAILHEGKIRFIGTPQECCQTFDAFNLEQAFLNCIDGQEVIA